VADTKFAVMLLHRWCDLEAAGIPYPVSERMWGCCVGFLPVFDTEEEARAEYPDAVVVEIREVPRRKEEQKHG
jgi:hypothetical protein